MIHPLRKRHQAMWLLLGILLPLGFIAAILAKPEFPAQQLVSVLPALPEGKIVKNASVAHTNAILYQLNDDTYTLALILDKAPQSPITTVYLTDNNTNTLEGKQAIGKVNGKGTYLFSVPSTTFSRLILYDEVHQHVIQTLSF